MTGKISKVLSIHWGFIPGGVAAYARHIEDVSSCAPLRMKSICINGPDWPFDEKNAAHMDMDMIRINGRTDLSWVPKVRAIVEREAPALVLSHGFNGAFVGVVAGRGIPIVSSWHGDYYPSTLAQKMRKPFFDLLLRVLFRRYVSEIVTVSEFSRSALMHYGMRSEKITVIHNGIAPDPGTGGRRETIRNELGVPNDCLLVGTVCRLAARKGLESFLNAAAIVTKYRQGIRFIIWGDGPQRESLENLIDELGVGEYALLPGYRSDIAECLNALDVFVMSSHAENFSIALLEAMRAELPIVATDVGGNPEAIENGREGILVPIADPGALAEGVRVFLDDPAKRKAMAQCARRKFLAGFTSDEMVKKTAQWLMECTSRYGHPVG